MSSEDTYEHHSYDVVVIGAGGAGLRAAMRGPRSWGADGPNLPEPVGQSSYSDGRGRDCRCAREPVARGQLGGPFPGHHEGRQAPQQLAHGRTPRQRSSPARSTSWNSGVLCSTAPPKARSASAISAAIATPGYEAHRRGPDGPPEMIRALQQQQAVSLGMDVFMELTVTDLLKDGDKIAGAFGYWRDSGRFVVLEAPAVILATGGIGKSWKVTSNSWECTGDGHALALRAGATLLNMEFVQFHPTGMVWPLSVRGLLVTESVRGDGGVLLNSEMHRRFMFDYIPEFFKAETADNIEEADRWYEDKRNNRRPPELLPRDEVARAINSEIKAGRGSPHGGVFLDIASRRSPDFIKKRLPSMYQQFRELADVDITKEAMEIGPTCHYVMGGVEVDADSQATMVPGLFAAGEVAGGMHGANRLGGNSLSDLLVFGKRAGEYAAEYAKGLGEQRPKPSQTDVVEAGEVALAPFRAGPSGGSENAYAVHQDLQEVMQDLVGIIRVEAELKEALEKVAVLRKRAAAVSVEGNRQYNPGWHLALDLRNMVLVAEAVALAALERQESRGGHTREDFPMTDPYWGGLNVVVELEPPPAGPDGSGVSVRRQPLPKPPSELGELLEDVH